MLDTAGEARISIKATFSNRPLHTDVPVLADQQELTCNIYGQTEVVVWKTCRERWMIGVNGERKSEKSVLTEIIYIYIYIYALS